MAHAECYDGLYVGCVFRIVLNALVATRKLAGPSRGTLMRADRTRLMRPALIALAILAGRPGEARAAAAPAAPTQAQATMVGAGGAGGTSAAGGGATAPVPDLFTGSLGYSVPIELPPGRN